MEPGKLLLSLPLVLACGGLTHCGARTYDTGDPADDNTVHDAGDTSDASDTSDSSDSGNAGDSGEPCNSMTGTLVVSGGPESCDTTATPDWCAMFPEGTHLSFTIFDPHGPHGGTFEGDMLASAYVDCTVEAIYAGVFDSAANLPDEDQYWGVIWPASPSEGVTLVAVELANPCGPSLTGTGWTITANANPDHAAGDDWLQYLWTISFSL